LQETDSTISGILTMATLYTIDELTTGYAIMVWAIYIGLDWAG
jgi:hypothetical protein